MAITVRNGRTLYHVPALVNGTIGIVKTGHNSKLIRNIRERRIITDRCIIELPPIATYLFKHVDTLRIDNCSLTTNFLRKHRENTTPLSPYLEVFTVGSQTVNDLLTWFEEPETVDIDELVLLLATGQLADSYCIAKHVRKCKFKIVYGSIDIPSGTYHTKTIILLTDSTILLALDNNRNIILNGEPILNILRWGRLILRGKVGTGMRIFLA